jgi:hypothetical protein
MKTNQTLLKILSSIILLIVSSITAQAAPPNLQDLLPMQEGYTIVTCSYGADYSGTPSVASPVVAIFNTSSPGGSSYTYPWECFHNETALQNPNPASTTETWTGTNLGEVFGITLDDQSPPNIYVTASSVYWSAWKPAPVLPAGETFGSVYRLDGTTGEITTCVRLPVTSEASLGNICFNRDSTGDGWLYVSNLDDGFIYRISEATCTVASTYAHGNIADDAASEFTPLGRRVWGVEVNNGRLYYAVWDATHSVHSIGLDALGDFDTADIVTEIAAIPVSNMPISDIEFSGNGTMYLAEREHGRGSGYGAHSARLLEYTGSSGSYIASPLNKYLVGDYGSSTNSAGGAAVNCAGDVWVTSNAMNLGSDAWNNAAYGMMWISNVGNAADIPILLNTYLVDFDGAGGTSPKSGLGEVEIFTEEPCGCLNVEVGEIACPKDGVTEFTINLDVTNESDQTAAFWMLTPCLTSELPAGGVTIPPSLAIDFFNDPLDPGETQTISFTLPATFAGEKVYFLLTILTEDGEECCTVKVCVEIPACDCFVIVDKRIECVLQSDGTVKWNLTGTLCNLTDWDIHYVTLLPTAATPFMPVRVIPAAGPIPPGGVGSFTACIESLPNKPLNSGDTVCFNIVIHAENIEVCCSEECCITLPDCDPVIVHDDCALTERAPCCPPNNTATVAFTICNNSPFPKSYQWNITSTNDCPIVLPLAVYSPQTGSINVPANACSTILISVFCEGLAPGECGGYQACFREQTATGELGERICCKGQVYVPEQGEVVVKQVDPADPIDLPAGGGSGTGQFEVTNPGTSQVQIDLYVLDQAHLLEFGNGEAPRVISLTLAPGQSRIIDVSMNVNPNYAYPPPQRFSFQIWGGGSLLASSVAFVGNTGGQPLQAFVIDDIQVDQLANVAAIQLRAPSGRRYKLQRCQFNPDQGGWLDAPCTVVGGVAVPNPQFDGANGVIDLRVNLVPGDQRHFFRVARLPE